MLVESVGTSIIVGKLRGGDLKNLLNVEIKRVELLILPAFIQSVAAFLVSKEISILGDGVNSLRIWIQLGVYILLFWGIGVNRKEKGFPWILIGVVLNFIVIMVNGGRMPVDIRGIEHMLSSESILTLQNAKSFTHIAAHEGTKLLFLGDILHIKRPYPFPKSLSVGDILMMVGIFIFLQEKLLNRVQNMKVNCAKGSIT